MTGTTQADYTTCPLVPDASGDTSDKGDADGAAWARTLTADALRQAIDAREATGYADGGGYNAAYTDALRVRLAALTG